MQAPPIPLGDLMKHLIGGLNTIVPGGLRDPVYSLFYDEALEERLMNPRFTIQSDSFSLVDDGVPDGHHIRIIAHHDDDDIIMLNVVLRRDGDDRADYGQDESDIITWYIVPALRHQPAVDDLRDIDDDDYNYDHDYDPL